jgi:hypothetical protein
MQAMVWPLAAQPQYSFSRETSQFLVLIVHYFNAKKRAAESRPFLQQSLNIK